MSDTIDTAGYVEVRLDALARNYARIQEAAAEAQVGAVVKADAYGLGAARIASCLQSRGCRNFFVATLEEGIALTHAMSVSEHSPAVYVFEGLRPGKERIYKQHALRPVLNTLSQITAWMEVAAPCAIQVDTGMSRLGVGMDELTALLADKAAVGRLNLRQILTHLSCADDPSSEFNARQLAAFSAVSRKPENVQVSIANTAGAFLGPAFRADLVRAGIGLYGGNPFAAAENPMDTVATLFARVLQIRELDHPAWIGYGATAKAAAGSRIATVGVGYADGYPRILGNRAHAAYGEVRLPIIGRVSMDLTCLDITALDADAIDVGDYVEMFGANVTVDELASLCETISYEVLTGLNARLPRVYLE